MKLNSYSLSWPIPPNPARCLSSNPSFQHVLVVGQLMDLRERPETHEQPSGAPPRQKSNNGTVGPFPDQPSPMIGAHDRINHRFRELLRRAALRPSLTRRPIRDCVSNRRIPRRRRQYHLRFIGMEGSRDPANHQTYYVHSQGSQFKS